MRISDWSSDVCSSDLVQALLDAPGAVHPPFAPPVLVNGKLVLAQVAAILHYLGPRLGPVACDANAALWTHQLQLTIADAVAEAQDRKSVVEGKSVSVRVDLGGRRSINKKKTKK